ncbi:MAG: hypothetical protein HQ501_00460 [Rhodospirillales bacterium]|nr:hypothetical protein [Rhodospirillales bacterium]
MIVGVDIGTQSLKVAVTDRNLSVLGWAAMPYQPSFPKPGWAEQDPALWENALRPAISHALDVASVSPSDIEAIGIGGQLDGCLAVGENGQPAHSCLIWMDRRAEQQIAELSAGEVLRRTGVILDASHLAAKIRWIKDNLESCNNGHCFHVPVSYIVFRLTGNAVMDHGQASTSMLYSLADKAFDPTLLNMFGITENELPSIAEADDIAGTLTREGAKLTGLPEGIIVAVGTGDDFSTPLGAGVVQPGRLTCVLGTAEVVGALHTSPVIDDKGMVETHAFVGGTFFIENPGWLSGGALEWFRETFRMIDFAELDSLAKNIPPGSEGLTFLPALSGTMAPEWIASARGCFYGLTPAHGNGHMARAVLEGTAFAMRDVIERLNEMSVETQSILLLGGGAKSQLWAKIRADMTGLPVEVPDITDTAPIGSAMLASVAAGVQPDLLAAAKCVDSTSETIMPNRDAMPAYDEAHGNYRKLFNSLQPMFT